MPGIEDALNQDCEDIDDVVADEDHDPDEEYDPYSDESFPSLLDNVD